MLGFIQNAQNVLKIVLKLGSIWDFPAKIQYWFRIRRLL